MRPAHVAQSVEHVLGKDEVSSSILLVGSPAQVSSWGLAANLFPNDDDFSMTTSTTSDNAFFGRI
jgi:hypothetical protein